MRSHAKTHFARTLRRKMTDAEAILWLNLRNRRFQDCKFRRQHPIGPYIVDFCCLQAGLIIELDGSQHMDSASDARRTAYLQREGFHLLRFWNNDLLANPEGVYEVIVQRLAKSCPIPTFPRGWGKRQNTEG